MNQTDRPLDKKVAIVTGAGRGIGKAIAAAYARAGASVVCAARSQAEIEKTVAEIEAAGGKGLAVATDVGRYDSTERMVDAAVKAFGGLDILVINAGVGGDGTHVAESDPAQWAHIIQVNLLGAYHCAKAAIAPLKKRGAGKILAIGSGRGHHGVAGVADYACSKAGLWMLVRVLAQELSEYNISVNELVPGPVITPMNVAPAAGKGTVASSEWVKVPADVLPLAMFLATQPDKGPTAQSYSLMRRDE